MMKIISAMALASAMATPAFAKDNDGPGEGRIEVRGGIAWAAGTEEIIAGAAAGYDFDLGDTAFIGVEASVDKLFVEDTDLAIGLTGRIGARTSENGRVYVNGGYSFGSDFSSVKSVRAGFNDGIFHAGAGYQHRFGQNVYGKVEYRRYFDVIDVNVVGVGIGFAF